MALSNHAKDVPDDGRGHADPQTYLHRVGRTGRFGRVGVSVSFVHDKPSWSMLAEIGNYFKISMIRLETGDWDSVEDTMKKVLKSPAADPNFQPMRAD